MQGEMPIQGVDSLQNRRRLQQILPILRGGERQRRRRDSLNPNLALEEGGRVGPHAEGLWANLEIRRAGRNERALLG